MDEIKFIYLKKVFLIIFELLSIFLSPNNIPIIRNIKLEFIVEKNPPVLLIGNNSIKITHKIE
tara:strand:+ start:985 stop:1173 length:189 start_codon:yes stop_codon:yes gene_type:complete